MKIILEEIGNEIFVEIIDLENNYAIKQANIKEIKNNNLTLATRLVFDSLADVGKKINDFSKK